MTAAPAIRHEPDTTTSLLASFGVELQASFSFAGGSAPIVVDEHRARSAYIHHSTVPVAAVAFALCRPEFASFRFPALTLRQLVARRPVMDSREARALAAVCGIDVAERIDPAAFRTHLHVVIARYRLHPFFMCDVRPAMNGIDVRPGAVDWSTTEEVDGPALKTWQRGFRQAALIRQMMIATIVWLYSGGPDKLWLHRQPCKWHVVNAIDELQRGAGTLRDWAKLVALYPGW